MNATDRDGPLRTFGLAVLVVVGLGAGVAAVSGTADATQVEQTSVNTTQSPALEIGAVDVPDSVPPGETLEVGYVIENTGTEAGTEPAVLLRLDGETVDTDTDVTVPANDSRSGTLVHEVAADAEGETLTVVVELDESGDVALEEVTVGSDSGDGGNGTGGADLQLVSLDGPEVLDPNQELAVNYTIENTGDTAGTEGFVRFRVDGVTVGADSDITVGAGERVTRTFTRSSFEFEAGDSISYTVELTDFADSASGEVSITLPDQSGAVTVDGSVETDSISVSAEVTELTTADERGWVAIENLDNDAGPVVQAASAGEVVRAGIDSLGGVRLGDTIEVRLAADSGFTQPLGNDTTSVAAGDNAPIPSFRLTPVTPEVGQQVSFDAGNSRGEAGGIVAYRWDFTGDGTVEATTQSPSTTHAFESAGQREVRLVVENEVGLTAERTKTVLVESRTAPPQPDLRGVDIGGQGTAATIAPGNTEISVTVGNVGDEAGQFTLTLRIGETVTRTQTTTELDGGTETTVEFGGATARLDAGSYDVTVSAANATASGTLTVETGSTGGGAAFDVEITGTNSPTTLGENLTATVAVENIGDGDGTRTVSLTAGELGSTGSSVTLDSGESTETALAVSTAGGATGEYDLTVTAGNTEVSTTVTVEGSSGGSSLVVVLILVLLVLLVVGTGAYVYTRKQGSDGGLDSL